MPRPSPVWPSWKPAGQFPAGSRPRGGFQPLLPHAWITVLPHMPGRAAADPGGNDGIEAGGDGWRSFLGASPLGSGLEGEPDCATLSGAQQLRLLSIPTATSRRVLGGADPRWPLGKSGGSPWEAGASSWPVLSCPEVSGSARVPAALPSSEHRSCFPCSQRCKH